MGTGTAQDTGRYTPPDLVIHLVHGTWGRGPIPALSRLFPAAQPRWFQVGSAFRSRLEAGLAAQNTSFVISEFLWSGSNSLMARARAGYALAQWIDSAMNAHPHARHVVIGHSHGGNVCMQALTHESAAIESAHLVTLATPFVEVVPSGISDADAGRLLGFVAASVLPAANYFGLYEKLGITAFASYTLYCVLLILSAGLFMTVMSLFAHERSERLCRVSRQGVAPASLLVIRAIDDEATLTLAAGALSSRISTFALSLLQTLFTWRYFARAAAYFVLTSLAVTVAWMYQLRVDREHAMDPSIVLGDIYNMHWTFFQMVSMTYLMLYVATILFRCVYGWEMAGVGSGVLVNSQPVPDSDGTTLDPAADGAITPRPPVAVKTLRDTWSAKRRLRHFIYDHEACAPTIVRWISALAVR